ncbi:hypothetical protein BGX23_007454 [Mortierella sp. AD031]|nr:hypothetical protein BGX23_007454 [Mortierella sp. AD031]
MEPALNRFKNMTELVILVASFLDRDDLASIRLTCHYINSICIPFFYRNVELNPPWQRWTTDGTRGLARHFSFVRLLRTDERSCFNYYLRLVEVFYNPTVGTSPSDSTTVQTDDSTSSLHMTIPTALDLILPKNLLDTLCEKRFIPAILSYVVAFSPHLTVLELNEIHIDAKFELQILARVLSGIGTLQSLTMEIFSTRVEPEDALTTVFYSCPPLVNAAVTARSALCEFFLKRPENLVLLNTLPTLLVDFPERKEPLRRLTDWRLNIHYTPIDVDIIVSFMRFLPELTSMDIPGIDDWRFVNHTKCAEAARQIVRLCPKLRHLSKHHRAHDPSGVMAFTIAEAMPDNTLESFYSKRFGSYNGDFILDVGLQRHSGSLKSIVLEELHKINTETLKNFFFKFPALEVFRIDERHYPGFKISMEDLASQKWASIKLRELQLVLTQDDDPIENVSELFSEEITCTDSMPPWTIGSRAFFRQVGTLADLRILDLRVAVGWPRQNRDGSYTTYKDKTIPGMLVLEDQTAGRTGWLQLLGGLRNLEELRGSFNLDSMLPSFEFGQREADWVVTHWPKLKFIEFYTHEEGTQVDVPPSVRSMLERLCGLRITRTFIGPYIFPWS